MLNKFQKNISLKNYKTFKIGGPAKYFFVAKTKDSLKTALNAAKDLKLPVFILYLINDNKIGGYCF